MADIDLTPIEEATWLLNESIKLTRAVYRDVTAYKRQYEGKVPELVTKLTEKADDTLANAQSVLDDINRQLTEMYRLKSDASSAADSAYASFTAAQRESALAVAASGAASSSRELASKYADNARESASHAESAAQVADTAKTDATGAATRAESSKLSAEQARDDSRRYATNAVNAARNAEQTVADTQDELVGLRHDVAEVALQRVNDHADTTTQIARLTNIVNEAVEKYFKQEA